MGGQITTSGFGFVLFFLSRTQAVKLHLGQFSTNHQTFRETLKSLFSQCSFQSHRSCHHSAYSFDRMRGYFQFIDFISKYKPTLDETLRSTLCLVVFTSLVQSFNRLFSLLTTVFFALYTKKNTLNWSLPFFSSKLFWACCFPKILSSVFWTVALCNLCGTLHVCTGKSQ